MISIAVCDDERTFCEYLQDIITKILRSRQVDFKIDLFLSGKEFVNTDMSEYQIVFLDISMDEMDGMATARKLRELCKETYVIFVTAFIQYTLEGYKVDAIRYLLKNVAGFEDAVEESLDAVFEKMDYRSKIHAFAFKDGTKRINFESIIYIESRLHEAFFHISGSRKPYCLEKTLNSIEKEINDTRFLRIHQSYLVNMAYIQRMKLQKAFLLDDTELPIAKSRYPYARSIYAEYRGTI